LSPAIEWSGPTNRSSFQMVASLNRFTNKDHKKYFIQTKRSRLVSPAFKW
jgi:hypothetical protein